MRAQVLLAMGLLYIVWGSTYLAIRVTVETLHPLAAGGVRFILAGLLTLGALAALGRLGPRPSAAECAARRSRASGCCSAASES